ncbi:MAG: hypothetical protein J07HX64_01265 [halophilic archaeon J07HX64]|nr:MAG: hypothetical protein J07HX64_01265 [halophilic archaeon J07HX64]
MELEIREVERINLREACDAFLFAKFDKPIESNRIIV